MLTQSAIKCQACVNLTQLENEQLFVQLLRWIRGIRTPNKVKKICKTILLMISTLTSGFINKVYHSHRLLFFAPVKLWQDYENSILI